MKIEITQSKLDTLAWCAAEVASVYETLETHLSGEDAKALKKARRKVEKAYDSIEPQSKGVNLPSIPLPM